jgi:hypothetical protein
MLQPFYFQRKYPWNKVGWVPGLIYCYMLNPNVMYLKTTRAIVRILNETGTLRKIGRMLIWGSHKPLHMEANFKSSVANDKTGFKVSTLKHVLECSKVNRQPTEKRETKFKEWKEIRTGSCYHVRTPRMSSRLEWVKRRQ